MKNADPLKAPGVPDYSATRSLGMDRQSSPAAPGLCPGEDKFSLLHNHLILEKFAAFFIRENENLVYSITFKNRCLLCGSDGYYCRFWDSYMFPKSTWVSLRSI
jgi:hypothetical protein